MQKGQQQANIHLSEAIRSGDIEAVEEALHPIRADVNASNEGYYPLHKILSVKKVDIADRKAIIRKLIEEGADVNARGYSNITPLHLAARIHDNEITQWLIEKGADVNARTDTGKTPLHEAASSSNNVVIPILIKSKANVNAQSSPSTNAFSMGALTPLHCAAISAHDHIFSGQDAVLALTKGRANPTIKDSQGQLPCDYLAYDEDFLKDHLDQEAHKWERKHADRIEKRRKASNNTRIPD